MPEVLLGVGLAAVEAKRFVSADLISAYCWVVAAVRWSRSALLVEDAIVSVSNSPSSSYRSPGVSPPCPLAVGMPGTMPWRRCAAAAVPNMSGASPAAAVSRSRTS